MLLSFFDSPLHPFPQLANHRLRILPKRPNFTFKPLKTPRLCSSSRFFCHANRSEDAKLLSEVELEAADESPNLEGDRISVGVGNPSSPVRIGMYRMSLGDQAFFLLAFIACTTSVAFTSLVIAAVPTLFAFKRAATSLANLADTAREELPSTMAAIRLSGMEISDLTLELSDLSQEISDGVNKSKQAVQAADAGIRQMGTLARTRTISMIQERANLPDISLKPVVARAAKKTSNAVSRARKTIMNLISRCSEYDSDGEDRSYENVEY